MAADISFDLDTRAINAAIDNVLDPDTRPLMARIGRAMVTDAQLNFKRQASPDGIPWKPTARGGSILRDTGRLRNSIRFALKGDKEVEIGPQNVIYARIHQYGGKIVPKRAKFLRFKVGDKWVMTKEVNIPARPFIGLADRQVNKINSIVEKWSDELLHE